MTIPARDAPAAGRDGARGAPTRAARAPVRRPALHDGLAVYRFGDGPDSGEPIFFMPGPHRFQRPGLRTADALIHGLTRLGRSVVTFDPPGSGRSTRAAQLGLEEMLACTDEALEVAALREPVDALGHSMGGFTLLAYALARPQRVRRLVLVGTGAGGYMQARGALWNRGHPSFIRMAVLGVLQTMLPTRAPEQLLRNLVERASFVDPSLVRCTPVRAGDWFRRRTGRSDWHRIAVRLDFRPRLAELAVPALVLCGRADPQFALPCSEALAAAMPSARLHVFERSGHYPFLEQPAEFWSAVGAFLDAPTGPRRGPRTDAAGGVPCEA